MPYSNSQIATTGKVIEIGVKKQQEPPPTWRIIANLALASKKSQPRAAPTRTRDTCEPRTTVSHGQRRVRTFASQGTTRSRDRKRREQQGGKDKENHNAGQDDTTAAARLHVAHPQQGHAPRAGRQTRALAEGIPVPRECPKTPGHP